MTEHPTPAPDGDDQTPPTGPVFNADVPHATPERPLSEAGRRALQEAHECGVRSYCITIDRHGADYLPRLYGPARYTVLDDARKLPLKVAEIYRRLAT